MIAIKLILRRLIKPLLPYILDHLVTLLEEVVKRSDNTIDDATVKVIKDNLPAIKAFVK